MKTIKQIKEEYDNIYLEQTAPDELMLEGRESAVKPSPRTVPSVSEMPNMLLFRRVAYRLYPNKQVVALYYSKTVDKYLSVPFGPDGNLNLSESEIHEGALKTAAKTVAGGLTGAAQGAIKGAMKGSVIAADPGFAVGGAIGAVHGAYKGAKKAYNKAKDKDVNEDWQSVNRKDKTDGLSQAAVNAYRRENPGSKLQTAVTEKNPSGKRAARRKSFCARMGGMKKRLTSAKTARDPDSRINKALRRWNCEESFQAKLAEKRQQKLNEFTVSQNTYDKLQSVSKMMPGYKNKEAAKKAWKSGDYLGAAKETGKSLAKAALTGAGAAAAVGLGARALPGAAVSALLSKPKDESKPKDNSSIPSSAISSHKGELMRAKPSVKAKSSWERAKSTDATFQARQKAALSKELSSSQKVKENKISDIQNMIDEGFDTMNLTINGRTVTLNNSMAKKIVRVYESVNSKNKKIVESMINEDMNSFKKLLNFSIKA